MRLIYLHGFASGPMSNKAQFFRRRFEEIGVEMQIPDLSEGNFETLTISGQLRVIERIAGGADVRLIGSSMGGYLAALYAARHPEVSRGALRFLDADALSSFLSRAWLVIEEQFGDWNKDPLTDTSPEIITIGRSAAAGFARICLHTS